MRSLEQRGLSVVRCWFPWRFAIIQGVAECIANRNGGTGLIAKACGW